MTSLPKGLQFRTVKPQGYQQEFRDYVVTPVQTYTNIFSVYDVVRIQFNLQDWYIDPYESFIEAEVRLADETPPPNVIDASSAANPIQFLMMDGPSTSLINDFRIESNSKEIERVREYDQMGNILTDLNMYPESVDQKDYEGYYSMRGKQTIQTQNIVNSLFASTELTTDTTTQVIQQSISNTNIISNTAHSPGNFDSSSQVRSLIKGANLYPVDAANSSQYTKDSTYPQTYTGVRSNYYTPIDVLRNVPDGVVNYQSKYATIYNYDQYLGGLTAGNTNYGINSSDYVGSSADFNYGYIPCLESPKLQQCDGHNIFLTNLPTSKIVDGKFLTQVYGLPQTVQSRAYMQIPLLSGVLGILIPQERWQLIPSSSLGQVNMEFRFNPNAFFSHNGKTPNWIVSKFQLKLRMYRFDSALMSQLSSVVSGGIQLHSQTFSMGPTYNIQPNVSVTNNWQLNNGIPSIRQLFFWFLSDDYQYYQYCRKNYRLSQNLTSMQLKISSTYIPVNPIIGHAGNIVMNSQKQLDNSVYLSELHQAMNCLFDTKRHININKLNFAINERPYDVTLSKLFGYNGFSDTKKAFLLNTGYALFNEMRCRGKALYAFNLESDKHNDDTMTGIDTTKVRPIELILRADDAQSYPRNSTMYVSFLCDFIVTFGAQDTTTQGQG